MGEDGGSADVQKMQVLNVIKRAFAILPQVIFSLGVIYCEDICLAEPFFYRRDSPKKERGT
ncbi:hypothetical protein V7200_13235 [Cytobacillus firmus]|uniref:hypothetical protein n=1 Tax=Cytobacillus firmus TaxID=1399 RepID=UPI001DE9DDAF|nr:hypothetical protein [Cytobacillus firmus]MBG9558544.1 hypothetical protein [Cytobacillus firmus]MBG9577176.1 hypothetical protein [Cytobacillus firmus]MBG9655476.1 hypothetical protein [Cytobacillus firmus]